MLNDKELQDSLEEDKKTKKERKSINTKEKILLRLSESALSINENETRDEDEFDEKNSFI